MRRIFVSDKSFIFAIQIVDACEDLHKIAVAAESICKILKGQGKTKFNKQFERSGELLEFHKRISKPTPKIGRHEMKDFQMLDLL
jgi:hypothetical protein